MNSGWFLVDLLSAPFLSGTDTEMLAGLHQCCHFSEQLSFCDSLCCGSMWSSWKPHFSPQSVQLNKEFDATKSLQANATYYWREIKILTHKNKKKKELQLKLIRHRRYLSKINKDSYSINFMLMNRNWSGCSKW